jgi:hypothetical protein
MVTLNSVGSIFGTIICVTILMTPVIIIAILGTRSKIKFAEQIQQNRANGAYRDWDKPPISTRLRTMMSLQLFLLLGLVIWLVTGLIEPVSIFSQPRLIILTIIFILIFTIGIVLQRMVAKGK